MSIFVSLTLFVYSPKYFFILYLVMFCLFRIFELCFGTFNDVTQIWPYSPFVIQKCFLTYPSLPNIIQFKWIPFSPSCMMSFTNVPVSNCLWCIVQITAINPPSKWTPSNVYWGTQAPPVLSHVQQFFATLFSLNR